MRYLFSHKDKFTSLLNQYPRVLCAFDYDGTLTRLRQRPKDALLPIDIRRLLARLARHPRFTLAIISGRALRDVTQLVRLKGIYYSGNHGLELRFPNGKTKYFYTTSDYRTMRQASQVLKKSLASIKGVLIEDKGIILAVHYRNVHLRYQPQVIQTVKKTLRALPDHQKFKLGYGKKLVELRPRLSFSKGMILKRIMNQPGLKSAYPIYLGDDLTDEHAFKVLRRRGLGILVGSKKKSHASYFVKTPSEVKTVLKRLIKCNK